MGERRDVTMNNACFLLGLIVATKQRVSLNVLAVSVYKPAALRLACG